MPVLGPFTGAVTGALIAVLIGAETYSALVCTLLGGLSGLLGVEGVGGKERFYWVMLAALIACLALVFSGVNVPRILVVLPPILMLAHLTSVSADRLSQRIRRTRPTV